MNNRHPAQPIPIDSAVITLADLDAAAARGLITMDQAEALWARWAGRRRPVEAVAGPSFGFVNVLYYFGGMIAIGSMSVFMGLGWAAFGPAGLLVIALASLAACLVAAQRLERRGLAVPAGILATLAIVLVPLAAWCLQHLLGLWPETDVDWERFSNYHAYVDGRWLVLEAATLLAGGALFLRHRHPFMVMPIAVTVWYTSLDLASYFATSVHLQSTDAWTLTRAVSLGFGLVTVLVAMGVDLRLRRAHERRDFAFWLYLFGAIMFWSALSLSRSDSALGKLGYCAINVAMVFFGAAIGRRVFTVLGALGVTGYLGYLSFEAFPNSLVLPFALALLGLAIVTFGIWWQRHEASLHLRLSGWLPRPLRRLGEPRPA